MSSSARKVRRMRVRAVPRVTVLEEYRLSHRLMLAARANGADDPQHFLEFLRQQRRGYSPDHDGPSELMRLVDDIQNYELRKAERLKAKPE